MPKHKTLEEAYTQCNSSGFYRKKLDINNDRIKSMIKNAETNLNSANIIKQALNKESREWMNVYELHYDSLRIYAECLLIIKRTECINHQCLFAFLCTHYSQLDLDWNFLERIRTKRNGINYYGENITYKDWKEIELQVSIYISTLKKEILKKL